MCIPIGFVCFGFNCALQYRFQGTVKVYSFAYNFGWLVSKDGHTHLERGGLDISTKKCNKMMCDSVSVRSQNVVFLHVIPVV